MEMCGLRPISLYERPHTRSHDAVGYASPSGVKQRHHTPARIHHIDRDAIGHSDRQQHVGLRGGVPVRRTGIYVHTRRKSAVHGDRGAVDLACMCYRPKARLIEQGLPSLASSRRRGISKKPQIEGVSCEPGVGDADHHPRELLLPLGDRVKRYGGTGHHLGNSRVRERFSSRLTRAIPKASFRALNTSTRGRQDFSADREHAQAEVGAEGEAGPLAGHDSTAAGRAAEMNRFDSIRNRGCRDRVGGCPGGRECY